MLEYKRSLKAKKLTLEQLPTEIKAEISQLATIEKNLIDAEKEENTELMDTLNTQFVELDSKIADSIDDYEPPKPADSPAPKPADPPAPKPEEKEGSNTGILIGALALIGVGIAVFFGAKRK